MCCNFHVSGVDISLPIFVQTYTDDMPFVDELVFAKKSHLPNYTRDKELKCDWSIIFDKSPGYDFTFPEDQKLSPIEQYKYLKETAELSPLLDETQQLAVQNFLQNRVSIIQVNVDFLIVAKYVNMRKDR